MMCVNLSRYPSDADKHMLATQTGLTRNQVRIAKMIEMQYLQCAS